MGRENVKKKDEKKARSHSLEQVILLTHEEPEVSITMNWESGSESPRKKDDQSTIMNSPRNTEISSPKSRDSSREGVKSKDEKRTKLLSFEEALMGTDKICKSPKGSKSPTKVSSFALAVQARLQEKMTKAHSPEKSEASTSKSRENSQERVKRKDEKKERQLPHKEPEVNSFQRRKDGKKNLLISPEKAKPSASKIIENEDKKKEEKRAKIDKLSEALEAASPKGNENVEEKDERKNKASKLAEPISSSSKTNENVKKKVEKKNKSVSPEQPKSVISKGNEIFQKEVEKLCNSPSKNDENARKDVESWIKPTEDLEASTSKSILIGGKEVEKLKLFSHADPSVSPTKDNEGFRKEVEKRTILLSLEELEVVETVAKEGWKVKAIKSVPKDVWEKVKE